jgi:hypothetical protein
MPVIALAVPRMATAFANIAVVRTGNAWPTPLPFKTIEKASVRPRADYTATHRLRTRRRQHAVRDGHDGYPTSAAALR